MTVTYEEAIAQATASDIDVLSSIYWVNLARELREAEGRQRPVAVQDVEAEHCDHHVIAVRLPGASSQWWHVERREWCVPLDSTVILEPVRAGAVAMIEGQERHLRGDRQNCAHCPQSIYWSEARETWIHVLSDSWACPIQAPIGTRHPGAWPMAR